MKENQKTMASKASGSHKLKRKSLPKFQADIYSKIPSDGLVIFAVHYLIEHKIEITSEDVVSACFLLFPHKFGLKKYPRWPDSAPISRHWGDVRRKHYVTANDYLGFRLTTKGIRLVKRAAKVLGVKLPKPIKKIYRVPVKKIAPVSAPVKQIQKSEIKAQPIQKEKATPPEPVKKIQPVLKDQATPPVLIKNIRSVRAKKVVPVPAPVKQIQKTEIKAQPVQEEKTIAPAPVKKIRSVRVKKVSPAPTKQVQKSEIKAQPVQEEKATQLEKKTQVVPISRPIQPVKTPSQVKETKAVKPVIIPPVKVEKVQAEPVSREAKERAGKFTRMMERSDAYIHYKKNGSKSNISEFDFRSLLLCTMESSAETLARNVELFKGYAGIHNRQDLIVFLTFCEDKFSYLLKPARKTKK
jgi:hypothetical protein